MFDKSDRSFRVVSFSEDQPNLDRGALIPVRPNRRHKPSHSYSVIIGSVTGVLVPVIGLALLVFVGASGYDLASSSNLASAPVVTIYDDRTQSSTVLNYGPQATLAQGGFFRDTRDAFINEGLTFVEADLENNSIRLFKDGGLLKSAEIISIGTTGSWWDTPAGLYQVENKGEYVFSNIAQIYLPWSITFEGNYVIHGRPVYPDGNPVDAKDQKGGIVLDTKDAEELYKLITPGTPILVYRKASVADGFIYGQTVPDMGSVHYLVSDLGNDSVLAVSDLDVVVPIASLTKLMSAVVASENIQIDNRVTVKESSLVNSLMPRLASASTVSMYSLYQLLLVESSNEAAEVIATELGRDRFIAIMNEKAKELGLNNTTFADPSGLSAKNTSSLRDLYRLVDYIYNDKPFIFDITAKREVAGVMEGGEFDGLLNFNEVKDVEGFVGGKVGETLAAGQTSVSLHEITISGNKRTVAILLLGSASRNEDTKKLLNFIKSNYGS